MDAKTLLIEMNIQGIKIVPENNKVLISDKEEPISPEQAIREFAVKAERNKSFILRLWFHATRMFNDRSETSISEQSALRNLFVSSVKGLYHLSLCFDKLHEVGVTDIFYKIINDDPSYYSENVMNKIIDCRLAIDWVDHIIRRNEYLCQLIRAYILVNRQQKTLTARGVDGPFSRLDLPMEERVFKWDEIEEEMRGRVKDRQSQNRYRMGLERYNDLWNNEGWMWRECRNDPYLFSNSKNESPYPSRSSLWG